MNYIFLAVMNLLLGEPFELQEINFPHFLWEKYSPRPSNHSASSLCWITSCFFKYLFCYFAQRHWM